jgi:hypothetical protein
LRRILPEKAMTKRLLLLILICSILVVTPQVNATDFPEFLEVGSYAQYKQEFSTGEIHELYWEITALDIHTIEIEIHSHGLVYNSSDASFSIVPGGGVLVVNRTTLQIVAAYHSNGTRINGYPETEKIAFWISTEINESTPINSMYESYEIPVSVGPLQFDCLSTPRLCWKTENYYSFGNQMNRYYDQETGIVLMIETNRTISSLTISVLETLNDTNIAPLTGMRSAFTMDTVLLTGGLGGLVLAIILLYTRRRRA